MKLLWVLLLVGAQVLLILCDKSNPEIEISQGILKGRQRQSRNGRTYSSFTGIPYAKPPIGELRFKEAINADPWNGKLDATKFHAICPQILFHSVFGSEDCLFLNVYTPKIDNFEISPLPVVFYIHGGSFLMGSGDNDWYGSEILLDEDIVLVTVNYRLGALGFMSTGDEVVPGNNGLKDQALALKWVKENIAKFGGDSNSITIMGHSSGGACSHLFAFSPLTKDLINGVISQSGNAFAHWMDLSVDRIVENTKKKAKSLSCPTTDNHKMIDCLRSAKLEDLIKHEPVTTSDVDAIMPFRPVVELLAQGAFLSKHPEDVIKAGEVAKVPFVTGITTEDGAISTAGILSKPKFVEQLNSKFHDFVSVNLGYSNNKNKVKISEKLREYYFGNESISMDTKSQLTNMFTDTMFGIGADKSVRLHLKYVKTPVYYYLFGYRGSSSHNVHFGDPESDYGVCHADELLYLFNLKSLFPNRVPSTDDNKMSDVLVKLWTNFIKIQNPTENWKPVTSEEMEYYFIQSPEVQEMKKGLNLDRNNFIYSLNIWEKNNDVKDEL